MMGTSYPPFSAFAWRQAVQEPSHATTRPQGVSFGSRRKRGIDQHRQFPAA
jgi:hypothetical protein